MEVMHPRCCGIDIHKESVVACLRLQEGRRAKTEVRRFGTTTAELLRLHEWLSHAACTHVARPATEPTGGAMRTKVILAGVLGGIAMFVWSAVAHLATPLGEVREVVARINRLKELTVTVNWGGRGAKKQFQAVRRSGPDDLVFQSLKKGAPMRDNNILVRHIKPAARKLGLEFVNWQVLRRSFGTWLKMAGVDVQDTQALMRHSRASTTMDIYVQHVPESQRNAVERLSSLSRFVQ